MPTKREKVKETQTVKTLAKCIVSLSIMLEKAGRVVDLHDLIGYQGSVP